MKRDSYLLILVAIGVSLFIFQNHTDGFDTGHHGNLSSHGMAIARNLSVIEKPFLMFTNRTLLDNGKIEFKTYNRFPVFPFLLIRLFTISFEPNLATQIFVARLLMDLFFLLSIILAYMLLKTLLEDNLKAFIVALFVFSSYFMLYYSDMIFNDIPSLFGFMLAMYMVACLVKNPLSNFKVIIFSLLSISMGWQVYSVLFSWLFVDIGFAIKRRSFSLKGLIYSPSFIATTTATCFGLFIILAQLLNEALAVGEPLSNSGTFQSALWRLGLGNSQTYSQYTSILGWPYFLFQQGLRIAVLLVPFSVLATFLMKLKYVVIIGMSAIVLFAATLFRRKENINALVSFTRANCHLFLVLNLSGFFWSMPLRHFVVFHDFQSVFYVGIPLAVYSSLIYIRGPKAPFAVLITSVLFIASVFSANCLKSQAASRLNEVTSEFQKIEEKLPLNARVQFEISDSLLSLGYCSIDFYTAGVLRATLDSAKYVISNKPNQLEKRLTTNSQVNLFEVITNSSNHECPDPETFVPLPPHK
jgi:hypothetical protein